MGVASNEEAITFDDGSLCELGGDGAPTDCWMTTVLGGRTPPPPPEGWKLFEACKRSGASMMIGLLEATTAAEVGRPLPRLMADEATPPPGKTRFWNWGGAVAAGFFGWMGWRMWRPTTWLRRF